MEDETQGMLYRTFRDRIEQALEGRPHTGDFSWATLCEIENAEKMPRYVIDRLRQQSKILQPDVGVDPYRHWGARISDLDKALSKLPELPPGLLPAQVASLFRTFGGRRQHSQRMRILVSALNQAPRVGETFARELLDQVLRALNSLPPIRNRDELRERGGFLEQALFVAGHFGCPEPVPALVLGFKQLLHQKDEVRDPYVLGWVAGPCFQTLRRLGLRDLLASLLRDLTDTIRKIEKLTDAELRSGRAAPGALQALLRVAAGWYYLGRVEEAEPIIRTGWEALLRLERLTQPWFQEAIADHCHR
jgi:hypothetical protein